MIVYANLDCEARWGNATLPTHVLRRISAASALVGALVENASEIWAPAAVERERLRFAAPALRVGTPPRWDVAWADPHARAVNDRRFALALASELGVAVPGARVIGSLAELDAAATGRWVCKAVWTSAGRDRCHGEGAATPDRRTRIARLLDRTGAVVFEPWLERVLDFGVCGTTTGVIHPPHRLLVDARGGFLGIDLRPPALTSAERDELDRVVAAVAAALARAGYTGPFGLDGFVHRDNGERRLQPFCEINARYTFGHVARGLGDIDGRALRPAGSAAEGRRGSIHVLGFGPVPAGATVVIAPTADDPFTAWTAA